MQQQRTHLFQRATKWLTEVHSVVTKLHFIICLLNFCVKLDFELLLGSSFQKTTLLTDPNTY